MISATPELQTYCIHKIYFNLRENITQDGLAKVGLWCIGEFANHLVNGNAVGHDGAILVQVSEEDVLDLIEKILERVNVSESIREFALTCLVKLYPKFNKTQPKIKQLIDSQTTSSYLEVQQRACEFLQLIEADWDALRAGILDTMPLCTVISGNFKDKPVGDDKVDEASPSAVKSQVSLNIVKNVASSNGSQNLLDLDFPATQSTKSNVISNNPLSPTEKPKTSDIDADLLGVFGSTSTTTTPNVVPDTKVKILDNLFFK